MQPPTSRHFPVSIDGINVQFPFNPYDTQKDYIKSVVQAIKYKQNALLESPTGTGKTLSLLCASLGWLSTTGEKSTIYYTSRTHSQLGQVAKEQKRTAYARVPSVVLGSRAQTCLNEDVRRQGVDHLINRACRNAIAKSACVYYSNYDQKLETLDTNEVLDIETLGDWGRKHQCCPYYAGKKIAETKASLVMMPYNYLLDPSLSKGFPLKLEKSVIIIDEAHNVDGVLKDAVSGKYTMSCLKIIQDSCRELPAKLNDALNRELHGLTRFGFDPLEKRGGVKETNEFAIEKKSKKKDSDKEKQSKPNLLEELAPKLANEKLQQVINCARILEAETRNFVDMETIVTMSKVVRLMESAGIEFKTSDSILTTLDAMISFWSVAGVMNPTLVAKYLTATQNFHNFVSLIFPESCLSVSGLQDHRKKLDDYYVAYLEGSYEKGKVVKDFREQLLDWTLNIWCLHPAIGLERAINSNSLNGPRSLILTSGTLAPMNPIEKELDTVFKVVKQFEHVIEKNQFKVMIIGESPDGYPLTSNFESTERDDYKKAIGKTLIPLLRILPHGTLVFFSSYSLMEKVIRFAKQKSTIWSELSSTTNIFVESKTQDSFIKDMYNYKKTLENKNSRAVFFGVCRGKLSEGINLIGNECRTVIMTGLPFPSSHDPKVRSTRNFQEKRTSNGGKLWYMQQMTRALNQTVGRVIRSKDDYGMLLLCDPRFKDYKYSLSEWTRPFIPSNSTKLNQIDTEIKTFFTDHGDQIIGSFSETVGAFEIGYNGSKQANTNPLKPAIECNGSTNVASMRQASHSDTLSKVVTMQRMLDSNKPTNKPNSVNSLPPINCTVEDPQDTIVDRKPVINIDVDEPQIINKSNVQKPKPVNPHAKNKFAKSNQNVNQRKKIKTSVSTNNSQDFSILDQFKDKNRPCKYQCFICLQEAKNPHKTNCLCARVGCLSEIRMLDKKVCGKCGIELLLKDFKQCLFKSAFYQNERQPVITVEKNTTTK